MFHIVLFEPEIPPNTGNIMRLCANTGSHLHLIHPLGFALDHKQLRRAGLDYREWADVREYDSLEQFKKDVMPRKMYACSTRGRRSYSEPDYVEGDAFLLGPETRGLPDKILDTMPAGEILRLPMIPGSRSLNLSNAAAVFLYEAWRQTGFKGRS